MYNYRLVIIGSLLFMSVISRGQQIESLEEKISLIRSEVEAVVTKENIPAVSLVIVSAEEYYCLNFGNMQRGSTEQVDEHSIYQIASLGKMFVGIIAQNLILEGLISVDEPITDHLDLNLKPSKMKKLSQIKLQHLLHHTSGLPGDAKAVYKRKDGEPYQYDFKSEDFETELKKARIKSTGNYSYSNFGFALLSHILEKASGLSFEDLLEKYITNPYHLNDTFLELSEERVGDIVTPYRKDNRQKETGLWSMGKFGPPSAIFSTTDDLRKLLKAQLDMYRSYGADNNTKPLILSYHLHRKSKKHNVNYGYGINQWTPAIHGHSGDMDGFASDYSFNIEKNYGIVLLTSSGEDWINPLIVKMNRILSR